MLNPHFSALAQDYLFPEIQRRVQLLQQQPLERSILRLGIGDVTLPLAPTIVNALQAAVLEMGDQNNFRGYGPENGYAFLREAIVKHEYVALNIAADEIFVSDGSKCDSANLQELFAQNSTVGITDPTYPVYVDANVMAGRAGRQLPNGYYDKIVYFPCNEDNDFIPLPPQQHCDVIYLCSPNNPTGKALTKAQLQAWVEYALEHRAIILYDAAYAAFIRTPNVIRSIYEIPAAQKVAIELRSFSKTAGFTGLRCAYTVVPRALQALTSDGKMVTLHSLWQRRQATKFNGVAYPIQRAAAAVYLPEGQVQIKAQIDTYLQNAQLLRQTLQGLGYTCYGGIDAPFIWCKIPTNLDACLTSWQFFDLLLHKLQIVTTPGEGFGAEGTKFIRFSAFAARAVIEEAIVRLQQPL